MKKTATKYYRYDLTEYEHNHLQEIIKHIQENNLLQIDKTLKETLINPTRIEYSHKKTLAPKKATQQRIKNAKKKIQDAINILNLENKKVTHYSIAKQAEVSYNTVKKYITLGNLVQND